MKLKLKDFQDDAVAELVRQLRSAARESQSGDWQSVCLSSATGSGKTVMLTKAIELLLQGDDENAPMSDATFLWITDQPELNEQTRKKMLATSSVLSTESLVVIDASFDREALTPGAVHFLNIQKLGKDNRLVSRSDSRNYSLWEIVRNTIETKPGRFFVVIDEAHRGMTEDKGQAEANTIIQKFIKGAQGELPPVPIVVGISATPERFNKLIVGTKRVHRPVDVDVALVRDSGLIKDSIVLHHPRKEQPTDMTMLREAARALKSFTSHWSKYCAKNEDFEVIPLLVIQVEDAGGKGEISETDIPEAMRMVRDVIGTMPADAFAHSFQEGTTIKVGSDDLRYLAPSDIQDDPDVRVVFFKTSLNTGWDCPRAEVMMSFRTAADATYIAQLVGRMVRTPLARRIVDNEVLNTVELYLPHYDAKGLKTVIDRLSRDDDNRPPVDLEEGDEFVELVKAAKSDDAFAALSAIPSYYVPPRRKASQIRRLMKLARLLTNDDIDDGALGDAEKLLIGALNTEYNKAKRTKRFKDIVDERANIEIAAVNWDVGTTTVREGQTVMVNIASQNVQDLFDATGRKLNEGIHVKWWRQRVKAEPSARERAKLELFALCTDPDVIRTLEKKSQEAVNKWLKAHKSAIRDLEEGSRNAYDEIRSMAADPEILPLIYPGTIRGRQSDTTWKKHLYVREDGLFPADLNTPETAILKQAIAPKGVVGWLRNIDRKPWALCIPYEVDGVNKPMYPDFLIVRSESGKLVVDIIDPHAISLADAPAKAAGMAQFADKHADKFGKIELILIDKTTPKTLDLTDEAVRAKVRGIKLPDELKRLFNES